MHTARRLAISVIAQFTRTNVQIAWNKYTYKYAFIVCPFILICIQETMYVYGGAKLPSEDVVDELWALDLITHEWTPHFNMSEIHVEDNITTLMDEPDVSTVISQPRRSLLPIPVRSHTAHVVDSKMVVLFGLSSSAEFFISYVQEYNFGKPYPILFNDTL